ncbi:MAG: (2Fe-2S)-binding protein [Candidatus Aminicenantales bacterium]
MEKTPKKKRQTITRRAFIKGLSGGAAGTALASRLLGRLQTAPPPPIGQVPIYSKKSVTFSVNGQTVSIEVEPRDMLLDILRQKLRLTGTKRMCGRGECGACAVLVNGEAIYSCLYPAWRADGKMITTVEGLAEGDNLHPVQQAFIDKDGYQCGFCTPGFIMSSLALLKKNPAATAAEIKSALSGHLCRCGNYPKIYEAVATAAQRMRKA